MRINLEKSIELYESGKTLEKIGEALGYNFSSIARVLRNNYPKYKGRGRYSLKERFEKFVMPEPMSGCWLWTGNTNNSGYGTIAVNRKPSLAHRISFTLYKGKFKKTLCVCHSCDNPSCVNPDHLFLGTHKDNVHDMYKKGRSRSKLDAETIEQIVKYRESGLLYKEIQVKTGINYWVIKGVISGNLKIFKPSSPVKAIKHYMIGKTGILHPRSKQVGQLDYQGNLLNKFNGAAEAAREINIDPSHITKVCRGAVKSAGGFKWKYL